MTKKNWHRLLIAPILTLLAVSWLISPATAQARTAQQCQALFAVTESSAARTERLAKLDRFFKTEGPRHVIVLPSQTLDAELAKGIAGLQYYELRTIWSLRFAFEPHTRVTYVTSKPVDPAFIDHLQKSAFAHDPSWRDRVEFVTVPPAPATHHSLAASLLWQKPALRALRERIRPGEETILMPFLTTPLESSVAAELGLPLFGALSEQSPLGSKSQSKLIFKEAGVRALPSLENIKGHDELAHAIDRL